MSSRRAMTCSTAVAAVAVALVAFCYCQATVSAITTSAKSSAIKTTLQIFPPDQSDEQPSEPNRQHLQSFAAASRFWQPTATADSTAGPPAASAEAYSGDPASNVGGLSAAQQAHILEDIRRHNLQQQQAASSGSNQWRAGSAAPSKPPADDLHRNHHNHHHQKHPSSADDQLQQLLQINGVGVDANSGSDDHADHIGNINAAAATTTLTFNDEDERQRQRSVGGDGWQPQYNNRLPPPPPQQQQPFLSPYVPPPPASLSTPVQQQQNHFKHFSQQDQYQPQQYHPTTTGPSSGGSPAPHHNNQQQLFVTTPSALTSTVSQHRQQPSSNAPAQRQQPVPVASTTSPQQQPFYPSQQQQQHRQHSAESESSTVADDHNGFAGFGGGEIDADIEQQIRQQLTAASGGGNYTVIPASSLPGGLGGLGSLGGAAGNRLLQQITGSASTNVQPQYVQIGGSGKGNRVVQLVSPNAAAPALGGGNKNTIVKTVVVHQKPTATTPAAPTTPAAVVPQIDRHQLELLARQVLPPGVAQYEIIKGGDGKIGSAAGIETLAAENAAPAPAGVPRKPVTFVILEERPDGTVRVRGVKKKGVAMSGSGVMDAPETDLDVPSSDDANVNTADDSELQKLVDRLNRGELRLPPSNGGGPSSVATDSAPAASATTSIPPAFVVPSSVAPSSSSNSISNKHRGDNSSPFFTQFQPTAVTTPSKQSVSSGQSTFFLPTVAAPTAAATSATITGHQHQQQSSDNDRYQQHQYYRPTVTATVATTTTAATFTSSSYPNSTSYNKEDNHQESSFSSQLRRRGYYAMAKYMRQAGVDAVLRETGPFTIFVPTDKAFRSLLVQLGGPDRAEDKFRENPRLLIGLLLHHVVPGAFRVADLRAGDEMTGVSLAGTQLRANLYARQLYDNRWNDIEVLTINGARVMDDVPAPNADSDSDNDAPPATVQQRQQRRDIVLSTGSGGNQQQILAIGHAVDRVLFPLPVGDVVQTMRADRQRRYSVFLRALDGHCSPNVRSLLTGSRTVTVFAPTDEAFRRHGNSSSSSSSGSIVDRLLQSTVGGGGDDDSGEDSPPTRKTRQLLRKIADRFVLSHVVVAATGDPPMYTAGLRFYQVRDTAYRLDGSGDGDDDATGNLALPADNPADRDQLDGASRYYQLTVYKDSGRIRLNGGAAQVIVRNVPATNGVLHGIDAPLV